MWQRIKTAIVLVVIVGIAIFYRKSSYPILILLTLNALIAGYEWAKLMPRKQSSSAISQWLPYAVVSLISISSIWLPQQIRHLLIWWGAALLLWIMALIWVLNFPKNTTWYSSRLYIMAVVLFSSTATAIYYLWHSSPWWLMYVFGLVWCADSGAYFAGRAFGRRKLAPLVSPNKTIEGLCGGVLTAFVLMIVALIYLKLPFVTAICFIALSVITVLSSVLGDLFESMLKRLAGVKDSGSILPGHGGILDRTDSILAATPIFAIGFYALGIYQYTS